MKKCAEKWATSVIFRKLSNARKFAQSGHPGRDTEYSKFLSDNIVYPIQKSDNS
jgi:hypothetical protein